MNKGKTVSATSYTSRIFKNYQTLKKLGYSILCSTGCLMVDTKSKNKETAASLFFSRCQRSKVIARVTQKALRDFLNYFRKPCSARLPTTPPAPDGHMTDGAV